MDWGLNKWTEKYIKAREIVNKVTVMSDVQEDVFELLSLQRWWVNLLEDLRTQQEKIVDTWYLTIEERKLLPQNHEISMISYNSNVLLGNYSLSEYVWNEMLEVVLAWENEKIDMYKNKFYYNALQNYIKEMLLIIDTLLNNFKEEEILITKKRIEALASIDIQDKDEKINSTVSGDINKYLKVYMEELVFKLAAFFHENKHISWVLKIKLSRDFNKYVLQALENFSIKGKDYHFIHLYIIYEAILLNKTMLEFLRDHNLDFNWFFKSRVYVLLKKVDRNFK